MCNCAFYGAKGNNSIMPNNINNSIFESNSKKGDISRKQSMIFVMVHDRLAEDRHRTCQKMTALRINDMKPLTNNTCVHGHEFSPGSTACFGIFENDCPFLFMSGGTGKDRMRIYRYDVILDDDWSELTKMHESRFGHKMHCVDKCLYVLGGKGNGLIEMYDVVGVSKKDKVKPGRPMAVRACLKVKVHNFPSAVYNDTIYVFGGQSDTGPVRCVQYYNTKSNVVAQVADLPCECHGGSAVVIGNTIYIATEQGLLINFDPKTGTSFVCSSQPILRKKFAMLVRNSKLCILGGEVDSKHRHEYIPDCWFDPVTDTWTVSRDTRPALPVLTSFVVEYPKQLEKTPLSVDPLSRIPHMCKNRNIETSKL